MGVFDRLQNYSAKDGIRTVKAPSTEGATSVSLKDSLDRLGFAMKDANGNSTELSDVMDVSGNQVINAIAGSGKTTALSLKVIYDMFTGDIMTDKVLPTGIKVRLVDKTWVCTFLRTGAIDLKGSIDTWQHALHVMNRTEQITFSTLDAEFLHTLEGMGVRANIGESKKLFNLLTKAINLCGVTRSDGSKLDLDDYRIIESIIVSVRGKLDSTKYQHPSCEDYKLTQTVIDDIIRQYGNLKRQDGINDFEDLQETLYKFLYVTPNPAVQEYVANRYNNIYVDEFQDTSQLQYELLKFYGRNSLWLNNDGKDHTGDPLYKPADHPSKFVVVGDVSQCIYSFKGSDSKILGEMFDADFRPSVSTLSCNWRCPKNILDPVIPSIHLNADSANQKIYSAREGGEFHVYGFGTIRAMLDKLKEDVRADVSNGLSVAILCRTNYDGFLPAFHLEMENLDFSVSSKAMSTDSSIAKRVLGLTSLFTERSTPAVKSALETLVPPYAKLQITALLDVMKNNNLSIWTVDEKDLVYSAPEIFQLVKMIKPIFYTTDGKRDKSKEVQALIALYQYTMEHKFTSRTAWAEQARALCNLYLSRLMSGSYANINDFLDEMDIYSDRLNGRIGKKAQISISTVHEFKGKEADSVIIWNDSDGTFPSQKCDLSQENELNEERRVHYIACTRAKKIERIYTILGKSSMFVREMDAKIESVSPVPATRTLSVVENVPIVEKVV